MKMNSKIGWIIGGSTVLLGGGAALYFLMIKPKAKKDIYGNRVLDRRKTGGISGGVSVGQNNQGSTLTEPNWNDPFDMRYEDDVKKWVSPKGVLVLDSRSAKEMAKTLYQAKGENWWNDDDEMAVGEVFRQLKDKVQVANLSKAFWDNEERDMWNYLNGFLSSSEMERYVNAPIRKLPDYRLA